jgi:hypothetical protein
MIGIDSIPVEALVPVALILGEALALYVGYGALTSVLGPHVTRAIQNR